MTTWVLSDNPMLIVDGVWINPVVQFSLDTSYYKYDPLQDDPAYRWEVAQYFYIKLKEKWLYNYPKFKSLCKFFKVKKDGKKITVSLLDNLDDVSKNRVPSDCEHFVMKYIEKYFISRNTVHRILDDYVKTYRVKWYDLYYDYSDMKDYIIKKLKSKIENTIYKLDK